MLKDLLENTVLVVMNYKETLEKEPLTTKEGAAAFFNKTASERSEALQAILSSLKESKLSSRITTLQYFVFIINSIGPLLDEKRLFQDHETANLMNHLSYFLENILLLMNTYHLSYFSIKYNDEAITVYGCSQVLSYSNLGLLLQKWLVQAFGLSPGIDCKAKIKLFIDSHQADLLREAIKAKEKEILTLDERLTGTQKQMEEKSQEISKLSKQLEKNDQSQQIKELKERLSSLQGNWDKLRRHSAAVEATAPDTNRFFEQFQGEAKPNKASQSKRAKNNLQADPERGCRI